MSFGPSKNSIRKRESSRRGFLCSRTSEILNCRRALVASRFFDTYSFDEFLPELLLEPEHSTGYSLAEKNILVEQVLSHLQLRQRRTIELIYYEGLTAEEVSIRTGETVRVVRHNLYRGLEKLRKALRGEPSSDGSSRRKGRDG